MKRLFSVTLLIVLQWCLVGCNDKTGNTPPLAKVSGTVTLDKQPMETGEIIFTVSGQPPKLLEIKNGTFAGEVFIGKNAVEVTLNVDGPPNPMDPNNKTKVNKISQQFWGAATTLNAEIGKEGKSDLKFDVTSITGKR